MSAPPNRLVGEHPCGGAWRATVRAGMAVVLDHTVGPGDTDHLGHMNIRRYAEIGEGGISLVLGWAGLDPPGLAGMGVVPMAVDVSTRHFREQHSGATLRLTAGYLDADADGLTVYAELHNLATGELAATFVQWIRLLGIDDRHPRAVPPEAVATAGARSVDWPVQGRLRTLALAPLQVASADQLRDLPLEEWNDGQVSCAECDAGGWFTGSLTNLAWGVQRDLGSTLDGEERSWLHVTEDGRALGLTNVENRRVLVAVPKAGDRIRTVAANIAIGPNRRVRREWSFDPGTGRVFAAGDFVDLVFDATTRRAVEIPDDFRAELARWLHPQLG